MDFYYIDTKGAKIGPIEFDDIENHIIKADTLVWLPGMATWQPAAEVPVIFTRIPSKPVPPEVSASHIAPPITPTPPPSSSSIPIGNKPPSYIWIGFVCIALEILFAAFDGCFAVYHYERYFEYSKLPHIYIIPYVIYWLCAIASIYSAVRVKKEWKNGDIESAQNFSRSTLLCGVISFVVGILFFVVGTGMEDLAYDALERRYERYAY